MSDALVILEIADVNLMSKNDANCASWIVNQKWSMIIPELPWEDPILPKPEFRIYTCSCLLTPPHAKGYTNLLSSHPTNLLTQQLFDVPTCLAVLAIFKKDCYCPQFECNRVIWCQYWRTTYIGLNIVRPPSSLSTWVSTKISPYGTDLIMFCLIWRVLIQIQN